MIDASFQLTGCQVGKLPVLLRHQTDWACLAYSAYNIFTFIPRLFVPQQFLPTVYPDVPIHCNLCLNLHQTLVVFMYSFLQCYGFTLLATGLFPHDYSFQITVNKFKKEISLLNRLTFRSTLWNSLPTKFFLLT